AQEEEIFMQEVQSRESRKGILALQILESETKEVEVAQKANVNNMYHRIRDMENIPIYNWTHHSMKMMMMIVEAICFWLYNMRIEEDQEKRHKSNMMKEYIKEQEQQKGKGVATPLELYYARREDDSKPQIINSLALIQIGNKSIVIVIHLMQLKIETLPQRLSMLAMENKLKPIFKK
ncbi:hypothetical protein ACJX0J_016186, partial [Zea mays]